MGDGVGSEGGTATFTRPLWPDALLDLLQLEAAATSSQLRV